jgi:hypothetical protein
MLFGFNVLRSTFQRATVLFLQSSVDPVQLVKAGCNFGIQLIRLHSPAPVPLYSRRRVHARVRAQAQDILHRENRCIRNRGEQHADQAPYRFFLIDSQVIDRAFNLIGRKSPIAPGEPAGRRVVVVCAGVGHAVSYEVERLVRVVDRFIPECKMQDTHPR